MKNFKNCLSGINIDEKVFSYLKTELMERYSFGLVRDLFSLPCMEYETRHKLSLLFSLLEDNEVNDTIIGMLCQILSNIFDKMWYDYRERLKTLIEENYIILNRSQLLLLAHTIELMYAKGYENTLELTNLVYQRISLYNNEFNADSDENVRIKLAKIAYSTSRYNIHENFSAIQEIKKHLKKSGRKHLFGILNYYKGICLEVAGWKFEYKDANYYILKSRCNEFELAYVYLNYRTNNLETSSKC